VDDEERPGAKTAELAIYVKSRGLRSDAYMALIKPFRHVVVYPAWLGRLSRAWAARTACAPIAHRL
jgi:uncharacterized protein DUF2867